MKITEILEQLNIKYCLPGQHHHVRNGWIGVNCPWCPKPSIDKGKWRLGIEESTGRCNCWTCGGHSLESVLTTISEAPYRDIKSLLKSVRLVKFPEAIKTRGILKLPDGLTKLDNSHKRYLEWRGLDPEVVERIWKLQGIGIHSKFSWRIFIPIYLNNEVVSWTTRSTGRNGGYINAKPTEESVRIKNTLYGIDLVRTTIIVCEGPGDVWNIGPGAVATFGIQLTPFQIKMITRFPRRIVCFDSDEPGIKRADVVSSLLSSFPGETINVQLDAEDPGSASRSEIEKLRKMAFGEE